MQDAADPLLYIDRIALLGPPSRTPLRELRSPAQILCSTTEFFFVTARYHNS